MFRSTMMVLHFCVHPHSIVFHGRNRRWGNLTLHVRHSLGAGRLSQPRVGGDSVRGGMAASDFPGDPREPKAEDAQDGD